VRGGAAAAGTRTRARLPGGCPLSRIGMRRGVRRHGACTKPPWHLKMEELPALYSNFTPLHPYLHRSTRPRSRPDTLLVASTYKSRHTDPLKYSRPTPTPARPRAEAAPSRVQTWYARPRRRPVPLPRANLRRHPSPQSAPRPRRSVPHRRHRHHSARRHHHRRSDCRHHHHSARHRHRRSDCRHRHHSARRRRRSAVRRCGTSRAQPATVRAPAGTAAQAASPPPKPAHRETRRRELHTKRRTREPRAPPERTAGAARRAARAGAEQHLYQRARVGRVL
jgi:hypothetical protein